MNIDSGADLRYRIFSVHYCSFTRTVFGTGSNRRSDVRVYLEGKCTVSRIMYVDESSGGFLQRFILRQSKSNYGVVPGIMKLLLPSLRIGFAANMIYNHLHMRKNSPMTRLQREMLATVVNGAIGGAP